MDKQRAKVIAGNAAHIGLEIPALALVSAASTVLYPLIYASHLILVNKAKKNGKQVKPKPFLKIYTEMQGAVFQGMGDVFNTADKKLRAYDAKVEKQKENERINAENAEKAKRAEQERQAEIARANSPEALEQTGAQALIDAISHAATMEHDGTSIKVAGLLYNSCTGEVWSAPKEGFAPAESEKPILVIPSTQHNIIRAHINTKREEIKAKKLANDVAAMKKVIAEHNATNVK